MTEEHSGESIASAETGVAVRRLGRRLCLVGTPLLLAITLWFHPHTHANVADSLTPIVDTWMLVHLVLLPLFGSLGVCLFLLLDGFSGPIATIGRIGTAIYFVCYIAFEAIAGIATGLLLREARTFPPAQQEGIAAGVQVFFDGSATDIVPLLAVLGTVGALLAVVAIAALYRRSGAPLGPVVLLGGVPLALVGHGGGTVDVIGMVLFAIGTAWLERDRNRSH